MRILSLLALCGGVSVKCSVSTYESFINTVADKWKLATLDLIFSKIMVTYWFEEDTSAAFNASWLFLAAGMFIYKTAIENNFQIKSGKGSSKFAVINPEDLGGLNKSAWCGAIGNFIHSAYSLLIFFTLFSEFQNKTANISIESQQAIVGLTMWPMWLAHSIDLYNTAKDTKIKEYDAQWLDSLRLGINTIATAVISYNFIRQFPNDNSYLSFMNDLSAFSLAYMACGFIGEVVNFADLIFHCQQKSPNNKSIHFAPKIICGIQKDNFANQDLSKKNAFGLWPFKVSRCFQGLKPNFDLTSMRSPAYDTTGAFYINKIYEGLKGCCEPNGCCYETFSENAQNSQKQKTQKKQKSDDKAEKGKDYQEVQMTEQSPDAVNDDQEKTD